MYICAYVHAFCLCNCSMVLLRSPAQHGVPPILYMTSTRLGGVIDFLVVKISILGQPTTNKSSKEGNLKIYLPEPKHVRRSKSTRDNLFNLLKTISSFIDSFLALFTTCFIVLHLNIFISTSATRLFAAEDVTRFVNCLHPETSSIVTFRKDSNDDGNRIDRLTQLATDTVSTY